MQLMHMLNCLYVSSWSGVCRYSPSADDCSTFLMIHGLTRASFRTKSVRSTTRSRTTGKLSSGSTRIGPGTYSERNVAHVSFGVPFTFIPQLPHTPMRHDLRYERVPSTLSLMWLSASRTTQSFRNGISYVCHVGSDSRSGRYRATVRATDGILATSRRRACPAASA